MGACQATGTSYRSVMTRETAPPGKTFEERWPDDAAEREWLAGPWVPVILGGFGGLIGLPMLLASLVVAGGLPAVIVVAVTLGLATLLLIRTGGGMQRAVGRLWRLVAWLALAAALGLLLGLVTAALCDATCAPAGWRDYDSPVVMVVVFGGSVLGSIAIAIGVDRAARRLAGMR